MGNFFYSHYIERYESKTSHLTMLQHGAYRLLLDHYYKTAKPIPEDSAQIVRISKAHSVEEIEAVTYVLQSFFQLKKGMWRMRVADEELVRMRKLSKLRGELGRKGGLANAKAKALAKDLANGQQKGSDLKTLIPNTNSKDQKQKQKGASRPVFVVPEWVPMENWQGYIEMRQRINKPMTERAKKFAVNCLRDLLARGHPPGAVLDQSVFQSWQGLFELRGENERRPNTNSGTNQQTRQPSVAVLRYANNDTEIERFQRARAAAVGSNHPTNGSGQTPRLGTGELGLLGEKANKLP